MRRFMVLPMAGLLALVVAAPVAAGAERREFERFRNDRVRRVVLRSP